ncbi:YgiQ family radical SAM protein [Methanomethylophilus alvi]|uniref:YgiQ family radical SAM protein n=1 Tax=Methanomethylophilus alvi TaxID=1291540 RepID=UPI0037DCA86C
MFIPTTAEEVRERGWDTLDVIIVSGDTYIDSSYNGAAVIGHWLIDNGFRTGIICQPNISDGSDITRLGVPRLFWSVTAGCVDSMVANYTPTGKFRKDDDFTPGGVNDRRPDRACIVYSNLIRRFAKGRPIVLGGIEASLRRTVHYDAWSDSLRRSIVFDAKADAVTYGMAELSNLQLAQCMRDGKDWHSVKGICYIGKEVPDGYSEMPSYEECVADKGMFSKAFRMFYENCDPTTASGLVQRHGDRYLVQNPPQRNLTPAELDRVHLLDYEDAVHPFYAEEGAVKAMDTIKNSITTHRGCYGECSFCAIAVHQGRTVVSRSADSIVEEAERIASRPGFNGIIYDVGGPTANMYGIECRKKMEKGACRDRKCLYPRPCPSLRIDHSAQIALLDRIKAIPGVRKVFVTSGIRHDMVVFDEDHGQEYVDCIVKDHVSGQLKIAPEHISDEVLALMGKPGPNVLLDFKDMFDGSNRRHGKQQFLTYYFMAAHPGCGNRAMEELREFVHTELRTNPEQVQIFTPTPSTVSSLMYYTRRDYADRRNVWSEHIPKLKQVQKNIVVKGTPVRRGSAASRSAKR